MRDLAPPAEAPGSPPRWALPAVLAGAAALRLGHWLAVARLPFVDALVVDSAEYDRWARALVAGERVGDAPFFQPPLYPHLIALVYRVAATPHAFYLVQIVAAIVGLWCLYRAGREMAGERAGLAAAAVAGLYGPFVFHDVQLLKESLAVGLVSALLWALAVARRTGRGGIWLLAGALLGALALLRENALLLLPLLIPLALRRGAPARALRDAALFAGGLALALAPVAVVNASRGGGFLPTTWQGGVNYYIGNHAGADGTYRPLTAGRQIPELERREPWRLAEAAIGRPLSAAEVSAYWLGRATAWARERPGDWLRLQLRKFGLYWSGYEWPDAVDYYWVRARSPLLRAVGLELGGLVLLAALGLGVAWRQRAWGRLAPALLFGVGWMLATVAFFLFSRYRLPGLVPLCLFAGVGLAGLARAGDTPGRRGTALAALLLVAWGGPRLALPAPRADLVHLNLGRLAMARGDAAAAEAEWRAALAADPSGADARRELGTLAARAGRFGEARALLEEAVARDPGSPEAWANLGAVASATGDAAAARVALDRALALDPLFPPALANRTLVELAAGDLTAAAEWHARLIAAAPDHPAVSTLAARLAAARAAGPR